MVERLVGAEMGFQSQGRLDEIYDRRQMTRLIVGFGKQETKIPLATEFFDSPAKRGNAFLPAAGVRQQDFFPSFNGSENGHARKRIRSETELRVRFTRFRLSTRVRLVQEEQVFAFDVEYDRSRVRRLLLQYSALKKTV